MTRKTLPVCFAILATTLFNYAQVHPDSTVGGSKPPVTTRPPGSPPIPPSSPWGEHAIVVSPSVQNATQFAFVAYNKNRDPVDASTFTLMYGTWVANLAEGGYFNTLTAGLQKSPEAYVNLRLTTDQANWMSLKLAQANVKISAQQLVAISGRSTDLERMNLVRSISTPMQAQGLFADLAKQIEVQPYVRDPNAGTMKSVKDDTACRDLSNLMMLNVYSGNSFGALVAAATLAPHCN